MKTAARFFIAAWICLFPSAGSSALHEVREVHYQMGTFLEIALWHSDPEVAKEIIRAAAQEVHRLEEILSNFDPDSAVSRLNQRAGNGKMPIPRDLYELLESAQRFSAQSAGDFDVTVGPLMELWDESSSAGAAPGRDALAKVLRRVGYQKLKLYDGHKAELLVGGMKIDLGGIGKGYAVDRIAERFKARGVGSALINFGGSSIYAMGSPPGKQGWKIGIKGTDSELRGMIYLRDMALSTSASMGKFWIIGGKRYGHLIDPKTGRPVSEPRVASAVAPSATAAEALTKSLILRGKNALPAVSHTPDAEAVIMSEDGRLSFSRNFKSKTCWQQSRSLRYSSSKDKLRHYVERGVSLEE